jgi:thiol-disulfide isomerase/thioredoxin
MKPIPIVIVSVICALVLFMLPGTNAVESGHEAKLEAPDLPSPSGIQVQARTDYQWMLRGLDGVEVDFAQFRGKVVFLNFWATWCPPCTAELPNIERLYEAMKKEDIVFINSSFEDEALVKKFISKKGLKLPIYLHGKHVPSVFISNRGIPVTFIIDRQGGIVYEHMGPAKWDDESVIEFLRGLL